MLLLLALIAVAALSRSPGQQRFTDLPLVPNPLPVKLLTRSNRSLVADLYWIRMASLATMVRFPADGLALIEWGRFVTELDPGLTWAYAMGGLLGPVDEEGTWSNVAEAVDLLERGTQAVPDDFRLSLYLAYTQLDLQHDVAGAARSLVRGARAPRAPAFLGPLAARLLAQGGEFGAAREFALQMSRSEDPLTRETFQLRLKEIDREEAWARLEQAVRAFTARQGHPPAQLAELVGAGLLEAVPTDPLGAEFVLQPDGGVGVTSGERLRVHRQGAPR
jgi:hypothetical protein